MTDGEMSRIAEFYRGKSVFVTGSTGFMGKVLVEKLLRSCSELDSLYLLARPKKGVSVEKRIEKLFSCEVFSRLKREVPNYREKVKIVSGDLAEPNLGLSQENIDTLCANVSIIFHLAAVIRFDQTLRSVLTENVRPLMTLLNLCKKMTKLQSVVYASTAYCNCDKAVIEEKIYPAVVTPDFINSCLENFDDKILESIKPLLIDGHPNTYSFSKLITENLIQEEENNIPLAIIRPSIVVSSWKEPFPGWIDTIYGPSGLVVGVMKGVVRNQFIYKENTIDIIPVDLSINMMIAISWFTAIKQNKDVLVYHCTTGEENRVTWGEVGNYFLEFVREYPSETIFRYPHVSLNRNRLIHQIGIYLDQYLPALLADGTCMLLSKKSKMLNICKKADKMVKYLDFYATQQWTFTIKNKDLLLQRMTDLDKKIFSFDVTDVDWRTFMRDYVTGIRKHLLKEPLSSIQKARRNLNRYLWLNRVLTASLVSGVGYFLSFWIYAE